MGYVKRLEGQPELPLVSPSQNPLSRLHVQVTVEQKSWIERQKRIRKMSESSIIRELIDKAMGPR